MKVFKQLSPRRIARYIKSFHHGSFMIEALGRFEFQGGGQIIEENVPDQFFDHPQSERTKLFLSQILQH